MGDSYSKESYPSITDIKIIKPTQLKLIRSVYYSVLDKIKISTFRFFKHKKFYELEMNDYYLF